MPLNNRYVEVILPLPVPGTFTYSCDMEVVVGQRVIVQFGVRKLYTAIVSSLHDDEPLDYSAKPVLHVLNEDPIVNVFQLTLWNWLSEYYMCNIGDVMCLALPSAFKLASESKVVIHPNFDGETTDMSLDELSIVDVLADKQDLTIQAISKLLGRKKVFGLIYEMIRKEIVLIKEELNERYKPKIKRIIDLPNKDLIDLSIFNKAPKQQAFLQRFIRLYRQYPKRKWTVKELIERTQSSRYTIDALVKKRVLSTVNINISRLISDAVQLKEKKILSKIQKKTLSNINFAFENSDVCLLHGVTSSGKTEIYIKLIEDQIAKGKQVLYLLPEIALTTQIVSRLKERFGDKVGVYHSNMNNSERVEVWKAVQEKNPDRLQYNIILGTRSSIFLPFSNIGVIIVDEEHDTSYKQRQSLPRYNARDVSIYLAKIYDAKVLLGSATPSFESYYNTSIKKYALVELDSRYGNISMPEIEVIDIRKSYLKKEMHSHFTPYLLDEINQALSDGKQIILFQNRRGYSPVLRCDSCGYIPNCKTCDVTLTYHSSSNRLQCHYCGFHLDYPDKCKKCGHIDFITKGFGTQLIEDELLKLFPNASCKRMDYDNTRKKDAYQHIITEFEQGGIDILVGTQMVTKGLDFDNVSVVGVLNADNMFYYPDFRAYERAFQLLLQVGGRAGRKKQGKVVLQTYDTNHEVIQFVKKQDFEGFLRKQLLERELFKYPPFHRLISITLKHRNNRNLDVVSDLLASTLRHSFSDRVLGPEYPVIARIRNFYHKQILLKIEQGASLVNAKVIIKEILVKLRQRKDFRSVRIIVDVDPL